MVNTIQGCTSLHNKNGISGRGGENVRLEWNKEEKRKDMSRRKDIKLAREEGTWRKDTYPNKNIRLE